jgi:hypothetical protein
MVISLVEDLFMVVRWLNANNPIRPECIIVIIPAFFRFQIQTICSTCELLDSVPKTVVSYFTHPKLRHNT